MKSISGILVSVLRTNVIGVSSDLLLLASVPAFAVTWSVDQFPILKMARSNQFSPQPRFQNRDNHKVIHNRHY